MAMVRFWQLFILLGSVFTVSAIGLNCSIDSSLHDAVSLSSTLTNFAKSLYQVTSRNVGKYDNVIISPISISYVLGMTLAGANENTAKQIKKALYLTNEEDATVLRAFGALNRVSKAASFLLMAIFEKMENGVNIKSVNRILVSNEFRLAEPFSFTIQKEFSATAENMNFSLPGSVDKINSEIQKSTNNKIKNLIPKGSLGASTKIILLNANYFKGNWLKAFNPTSSKIRPFYARVHQRAIPTKMMASRNYFKVAHINEADARAIELPYTGSRISMIILLPNQYLGLARLETALSSKLLNSINKRLRKTLIDVVIPKFKIEASLDLKHVLKNLGVSELFRETADLSRMSSSKGLYVSDAFHRAFIEVNEKGTEAAATTVFKFIARSSRIPFTQQFIADHPFIFLIRDNATKMILFMGRFCKPERG